jgi:NADPH-dependent 2,4-dienoyl-CoA reductase/sulfur reductase-like enzyme
VPGEVLHAPGRRLLTSVIPTGDHDLVIIGGGVAGYVAAIKAGQEGLKVRTRLLPSFAVPNWVAPAVAIC